MSPSDENKIRELQFSALELLRRMVREAQDARVDDGPLETTFNYRHASNIVWLTDELLSIMDDGHIAAPAMVARAMLESVFNLAASTSIPNFAVRKTVWELRDRLVRLKNLGIEGALGDQGSQVLAQIERLEREYQLTPKERSWPVSKIATVSGITDFLRKEYLVLSGHVHSSSFALLSRQDCLYEKLIHQTVINCLVLGTGFAAQLLPTKNPQADIDKATELGAQHIALISRGVFRINENHQSPPL